MVKFSENTAKKKYHHFVTYNILIFESKTKNCFKKKILVMSNGFQVEYVSPEIEIKIQIFDISFGRKVYLYIFISAKLCNQEIL